MARDAGAVPVIPGRRNRKRAIRYDQQRYAGCHFMENAFCRFKDFRRIATRYDKLAPNFLLGVALANATEAATSTSSSSNVCMGRPSRNRANRQDRVWKLN